MNFSFYLLKFLRILLFPFSLIYGLIVVIRNYLFDRKILKSVSFDIPIIGVGNLSVGGTGKSPMVEHLIKSLQSTYSIATLSRGYGRKTKGYLLATATTTALEIGDEPMQFHQKFPDVAVAVGEERVLAVPKLLQDRSETDVIILDDCFQHRWIKPGFNILLTDWSGLFTRDFFLPTGSLRDQKASSKRANVIVVTKCPADISQEEMTKIQKETSPLPKQEVFFTTLQYGVPYHINTKEKRPIAARDNVLLLTGIADPKALKKHILQQTKKYHELTFSDHHTFTMGDIKEIRKKFDNIKAEQKIVITTEKDAVRLIEFNDALSGMQLYVLPVRHEFLQGRGIQFDYIVNTFIERFQDKNKHE